METWYFSNHTTVESIVLECNLHFRVMFGEHAQTFEGRDNAMTPRAADAVVLGPNVNIQGGIRCFSLLSGRILSRQ